MGLEHAARPHRGRGGVQVLGGCPHPCGQEVADDSPGRRVKTGNPLEVGVGWASSWG